MNKDDIDRLQFMLLSKLGVTGGYIEKMNHGGVYLYLSWGAIKRLYDSSEQTVKEDE